MTRRLPVYTFRQMESILKKGMTYLGTMNNYYECSVDTKVPNLMTDDTHEVWFTIYLYRAESPGGIHLYNLEERPMNFNVYTKSIIKSKGIEEATPQEQIKFKFMPLYTEPSGKREIQVEMFGKWVDVITESTEYDYDAEIGKSVIPNDKTREIVLRTVEWVEDVVERFE